MEQGRENGYVTTLYGRRRTLPELASSNFNVRSLGERMAMNTPIQGTAADIIKLAMVRVYRRLKAEGLRARLILQVHDELIVECPAEEKRARGQSAGRGDARRGRAAGAALRGCKQRYDMVCGQRVTAPPRPHARPRQ